MCGRYALALSSPALRRRIRDYGLPVDGPDSDGRAPQPDTSREENSTGHVFKDEATENEVHKDEDSKDIKAIDEGYDAVTTRQSYNIAPGYIEPVYRAVMSQGEYQSGDKGNQITQAGDIVRYVVQGMKWGLVPSWTKGNSDYRSIMKTINCRDDSLLHNSGMWNSMKKKKRCVVLAEGFYEWQKKGKDKIPHYIKRKDGNLFFMAGLWDCATLPDASTGESSKLYTYTIITVSASSEMQFLHDRMPAILTSSEDILTWLNPTTISWTPELQNLLRPFPGALEIYAVPKEVGKVGNNDKSFVQPRDSQQNRSNIKNWFGDAASKKNENGETRGLVKSDGSELTEEHSDREPHKRIIGDVGQGEVKTREGVTTRHEGSRTEDNATPTIAKQMPDQEVESPKLPSPLTMKRKHSAVSPQHQEDYIDSGKHDRETSEPTLVKNGGHMTSPSKKRNLSAKRARNASEKGTVAGDGSLKITNFFSK